MYTGKTMNNPLLNVSHLDIRLHEATQKGIDTFIISSTREGRPDLNLVPDYRLKKIFRDAHSYAYHQLGYEISKAIENEYNPIHSNRRSPAVGKDDPSSQTSQQEDVTK